MEIEQDRKMGGMGPKRKGLRVTMGMKNMKTTKKGKDEAEADAGSWGNKQGGCNKVHTANVQDQPTTESSEKKDSV